MAENENVKFCPNCGRQVNENENFCVNCGTKLNIIKKNVSDEGLGGTETQNTDTELEANLVESDNAADSDNLSEPQQICTADEAAPAPKSCIPQVKKAKGILDNVSRKNSVIISVATVVLTLIFLLLALCPMFSMKFDFSKNVNETVHISAIDTVLLSVDSFFNLNKSELSQTELYKTVNKLQNELNSDINDGALAPGTRAKLNDLWLQSLRLELQSADSEFNVTIISAGLISAVYMVLCAVAFIKALINLIKAVFRKKLIFESVIKSLLNITIVLPILCFITAAAFSFDSTDTLAAFAGYSARASYGFWASIALSVLLIVTLFISAVKYTHRFKAAKGNVKHAAAAALAFIMLISVFLPCITMNATVDRGGKPKNIAVSVAPSDFDILSEEKIKHYDYILISSSEEEIFNKVAMLAQSSSSNTSSRSGDIPSYIMDQVFLSSSLSSCYTMYIAMFILSLLLMLLSGILLRREIIYLCVEENNTSGMRVKVFCMIASTAIAILTIILYIIALINAAHLRIDSYFNFSIGFGTVLMIASSIATLVLSKKAKPSIYFDKDFDNADTSYAPYVANIDN